VSSIIQVIEEESKISSVPIKARFQAISLTSNYSLLSRRYSWSADSLHQTIFSPSWTSISIQGISTYFDQILICKFSLAHWITLRWDQRSNKAVAEGAISYKLDHSVTSRVSRYTYGIKCCKLYDSNDPEHISRKHTCFTRPSGTVNVNGYFSVILEKVSITLCSSPLTHTYTYSNRTPRFWKKRSSEILSTISMKRRTLVNCP